MREGPTLVGLALGFVWVAALFAWLETRFRSTHAPLFFRRRDFRTDLVYWLFTPLVARAFTRLAVGAAVLSLVALGGGSVASVRGELAAGRVPELGWQAGRDALRALPFAAQLLLGLALADLLSYWMHRAFHARWLWPFHAVHHSSPRLDWLSSVRLHPVNQALMNLVQAVPLLFLGFDPRVFGAVAPLLALHGLFLHANLRSDFGPLARCVASPRFHRWHHTSAEEGRDKNFAALCPLWDVLFGTYFAPPGRAPTEFGAGDEPVPAGIWRQLAYPLRRAKPGEAMARDAV